MALLAAAELCLRAMTTSLMLLNEDAARSMMREMPTSPFSEAAMSLNLLLSRKPDNFVNEQAIKALVGKIFSSHISRILICFFFVCRTPHHVRFFFPHSRMGGVVHGKQSAKRSFD